MTEKSMSLTAEEQDLLVGLLEAAQKSTLVEEHRTRTLEYREHIVQREKLITGLLGKVRAAEVRVGS
jgi:hypothetical protein